MTDAAATVPGSDEMFCRDCPIPDQREWCKVTARTILPGMKACVYGRKLMESGLKLRKKRRV